MYTINIGLRTSARYGLPEQDIPAAIAKRAVLNRLGAITKQAVVAQEGSEDTLVVALPGKANRQALALLSDDLAQDCIAVLDYDGHGSLVGPYREAWGEFNPAYFKTISVGVPLP